jgi:hypothetical protein
MIEVMNVLVMDRVSDSWANKDVKPEIKQVGNGIFTISTVYEGALPKDVSAKAAFAWFSNWSETAKDWGVARVKPLKKHSKNRLTPNPNPDL